jgi:hypothetical protein
MAPQTRQQEREESSRLSLRTLVIASVASATAAVVTSQFWVRGTWIAAAMTHVIMTIVQELLHRPTEKIATALTSDSEALVPRPRRRAHAGVREELGAPREAREAEAGERAARREAERSARAAEEAPVRVYGRGPTRPRRRRIAIGAVAVTAFLAFAVAAVALTVPELITGQSIGKSDRGTTLFGGKSHKKNEQATPTDTQTTPQAQPPSGQQTQETQPQQQTQETQPQETTTQPSPRAAPQQTQTQPSP